MIRSAKRRRTVQARQVGDVLRISIPAAMTKAEEDKWVGEMVRRMERKAASSHIDLEARAATLSRKYGLGRPRSVRWVDNQQWRWGSCTPSDGAIRLSSRLAGEPAWVVDYVLVHELAHLSVRHHNAAFWKVVHRYPLAERALGYLMARGLDADMLGATDPGGGGGTEPPLPPAPQQTGPGPGWAERGPGGQAGPLDVGDPKSPAPTARDVDPPPRPGPTDPDPSEPAADNSDQPEMGQPAGLPGEVAAFRPPHPTEPPPGWTGSLF